MELRDTIVAPATPAGEGGIGIVRISGPDAGTVMDRLFRPSRTVPRFTSHRLYFGYLVGPDDQVIDEVMAVIMRSPNSYTREDVVEIQCHGGPLVVRRIIDLCLDGGLRLARPGEFTLRAFLNGRIDLARAEAVIDVIRSSSEAALRVSSGQLEGRLSEKLRSYQRLLSDVLAEVETHLDFADEDIEHAEMDRLTDRVSDCREDIEKLLATFDTGRVLRDGLAVLILGRPNVGKSSLLNTLLGESRAIVTAVPGTTRDTIEERFELEGIPVRLVDSAGMRQTEDPIEAEGVRRARDKIAVADLVLLVIDGSSGTCEEDRLALEATRGFRVLTVINKCDLSWGSVDSEFLEIPHVRISARSGEGVEELRREMARFFVDRRGVDSSETIMLSDRRHRQALLQTSDSLRAFREGSEAGLSPEFLAIELRDALKSLGEITGETTTDEILEKIFSRFCIGK